MARYFVLASAAAITLALATPALAHHSFAAEFDGNNAITVTGVVKSVQWTNPHTWFYLDVMDANGKTLQWGFEGGTPTGLVRAGIKANFLKVGDKVTMKGFRARDLTQNYGAVREIILADGRSFTVGPSDSIDHKIRY
jgi:hypothetical protein